MLPKPCLHVVLPSHREHYHVVTALVKPAQKLPSARSRIVKVAGAAPSVEQVQDAVQIDTHDWLLRQGSTPAPGGACIAPSVVETSSRPPRSRPMYPTPWRNNQFYSSSKQWNRI